MDLKKLQNTVIEALEDVKAQDIRVYDTVHLTSLFDRIAIASGTSNRQTKALAASVRDKVKENGGTILSVEGETTGEWVLVDLGDMIVHIMQPAIRAYYRLEEIWGEKEVKLGAAKRLATRSSAESAESGTAPKKVSRHLTINQATTDAVKKPAAKKSAASADSDVKKVAPKVAATKKASPKTAAEAAPTAAAARKPAVKKTAAGAAKPAASAAKKAPVQKIIVKAPAKATAEIAAKVAAKAPAKAAVKKPAAKAAPKAATKAPAKAAAKTAKAPAKRAPAKS